jgi:NTP pyrophosphatase (non-canonical NTP hydrolase)
MKPIPQSNRSLEEINQKIWKHLEDRDWHKNKPRDIAISIALEANELLEHYQWTEQAVGGKDAIASELADILVYAFQFAQLNDIDLAEAMDKKMAKAAEKYPAELFKGKGSDDRQTAWIDAKMRYNKNKQGL